MRGRSSTKDRLLPMLARQRVTLATPWRGAGQVFERRVVLGSRENHRTMNPPRKRRSYKAAVVCEN